jgi:NitT/TauT family transport system permease protein
MEIGRSLRKVGTFAAMALVILAIFLLIRMVFDAPGSFVPSANRVAHELISNPTLYISETWVTLYEVIIAFIIAAALGLSFAIAISYSRVLARFTYPIVLLLQVVPKVAIAPLLIVWLGFGVAPRIVLGVLVGFFPIVISGVAGLTSVSSEMLNVVRVLNATPLQELWRVRLPASLPQLFGGFKVAMTLAVAGVVIGELSGGGQGLGYLVVLGNAQLELEMSFAALFMLSVVGVGLFATVNAVERLAIPWVDRQRSWIT